MDSSGLANHVVALVKGVTTSQTIDMAIVLQVSSNSHPDHREPNQTASTNKFELKLHTCCLHAK